MKIAVYPGSFDPITMGHLDVIERASHIFDKVIVAVGENPDKKCFFSVEERQDMARKATRKLGVEVDHFSGLLVDYVKKKKAQIIIRGLRAVSDFDYEFQRALMNRKFDRDIETVFIMTRGKYCYLSSSVVREVAALGGDLQGTVPEEIISAVEKKLRRQK